MEYPLPQALVPEARRPAVGSTRSNTGDSPAVAATPDRGTAAAGCGGHPVRVIRGESGEAPRTPNEARALIDWLAFTVPPKAGRDWRWMRAAHDAIFNIQPESWQGVDRKWSGYAHRVDLIHPGERGETIPLGLFAYGGESQLGTLHTSLNAQGCARISDWNRVKDWLVTVDASITRVDCAHDDFEGRFLTIAQAITWYREGAFNTNGRPPKARHIDDMGSGQGQTFYVGNRAHGKLLRFYEKGKKEGDPASPWVRVEVEFRNKSRRIPPEILQYPGRYLAGSYYCLRYLDHTQSRIQTIRKAGTSNYKQMVDHLRHSAGKGLNAMYLKEGDAESVLALVRREGVPKRLAPYLSGPGGILESDHAHAQP